MIQSKLGSQEFPAADSSVSTGPVGSRQQGVESNILKSNQLIDCHPYPLNADGDDLR